MKTSVTLLRALIFLAAAGLVQFPAHATQIGTILVCYACDGTGTQPTGDAAIDAAVSANPGLSDGILFDFDNTSGFAITGAVFSVGGSGTTTPDSFALPTIAAGSEFILIPGITSDGNSHPSGGLFAVTGSVMDTSDGAGGLSDASIFQLTGISNGLAVTSLTAGTSTGTPGTFTPGDPGLLLPYRDNPTGTSESFIGQGPSGDGGCNNCYYGEVATLNTPNPGGSVPEPASLGLVLCGIGLIGWLRRR